MVRKRDIPRLGGVTGDSRSRREDAARVDAAQQQLKASASALLEEHLRAVAQRSVDAALSALSTSGAQDLDGVRYRVEISRTESPGPPREGPGSG